MRRKMRLLRFVLLFRMAVFSRIVFRMGGCRLMACCLRYRSILQSYCLLLWAAARLLAIILIIEAVFSRTVSRMDGFRLKGYHRNYRSSLHSYCLHYGRLLASTCRIVFITYGCMCRIVFIMNGCRLLVKYCTHYGRLLLLYNDVDSCSFFLVIRRFMTNVILWIPAGYRPIIFRPGQIVRGKPP